MWEGEREVAVRGNNTGQSVLKAKCAIDSGRELPRKKS